ncbi:hypothetical protein SAMN05444156_0497 [Verrucomicrobium sp. GAS474]|uniref:hypothetical protein n=1 Tax=Verrucomicrobium sp. GAS474 TaxID=1882831 RepID=UPI00087D14B4|nr:hypothetical protein [Verrucomicrobium sp. GAS474]SDT89343.1 hypothetical protein SAMN05444156_0497 [Verrucomicrobium sp. GAS474]
MPNAVDTGAMHAAKQANLAESPALSTPAAPGHQSLHGAEYTFTGDQDRRDGIDAAFDYRGDVTLRLSNGEALECFLFNRTPNSKPPQVQLFVKGEETPRVLPYVDIVGITFTGKDPADGKSYLAWKAKKHNERVEESRRVEEEMRQQGIV